VNPPEESLASLPLGVAPLWQSLLWRPTGGQQVATKRQILEDGTYSITHTVDGQNPASPRMMIIPLFIGF